MQVLDRLLNRQQPVEPEIVKPLDARLLSKGATKVPRTALSLIPTPPATDTFKPISHHVLIDQLEEALSFRHMHIVNDEYAISPDGSRLFSLLEINAEYEGVRFAIGLRNAHDKSMRIGMVCGYRVMICTNMSLFGDFAPLLAKHSKNFDLTEALAIGVDRLQRKWQPLKEAINCKRNFELTLQEAQIITYRLFTEGHLPVKLLKVMHKEYFMAPSYDEFKPRTVWSLENAATTAIKQLKPIQQFQATARLGKFLMPYSQVF